MFQKQKAESLQKSLQKIHDTRSSERWKWWQEELIRKDTAYNNRSIVRLVHDILKETAAWTAGAGLTMLVLPSISPLFLEIIPFPIIIVPITTALVLGALFSLSFDVSKIALMHFGCNSIKSSLISFLIAVVAMKALAPFALAYFSLPTLSLSIFESLGFAVITYPGSGIINIPIEILEHYIGLQPVYVPQKNPHNKYIGLNEPAIWFSS